MGQRKGQQEGVQFRLESEEVTLSFSTDQDNQNGTFSGYTRKYEIEGEKDLFRSPLSSI